MRQHAGLAAEAGAGERDARADDQGVDEPAVRTTQRTPEMFAGSVAAGFWRSGARPDHSGCERGRRVCRRAAAKEEETTAEEEGQRIVQLARDEAEKQAEEHDIIKSANQKAQTIMERAQREAEKLKAEADEYAREVLVSLNEQLGTVDSQIDHLLMTVRNGLDTLSRTQTPESDPEP